MRRLRRLSLLLLLAGLGGAVACVLWPPEMLDAGGRVIGEMPPAFAVAFDVAFLGAAGWVVGVTGGVLVWAAARLRARRRGP